MQAFNIISNYYENKLYLKNYLILFSNQSKERIPKVVQKAKFKFT